MTTERTTEIVEIELDEIIDCNFYGFLELLEERIDKGVLEDISYELKGSANHMILVEVSANLVEI